MGSRRRSREHGKETIGRTPSDVGWALLNPNQHPVRFAIAAVASLGVVVWYLYFKRDAPTTQETYNGPINGPVIHGAVGSVNVLPPPAETISGPLRPGGEPTPPNKCDESPDPSRPFKILFGKSGILAPRGVKFTPITIGTCDVLSISWTSGGEINVDARLFDEDGKLLASVHDNVFDSVTAPNLHLSRQGSLSTLSVTDDAQHELLYVRYVNADAMVVRGRFGCYGHATVRFDDYGIHTKTTEMVAHDHGACFEHIALKFE